MEYIWIGSIVIFIILIAIMFISTINEIRAERMRNMDFNISCKRIEGQLRKNGINIIFQLKKSLNGSRMIHLLWI